MVCGQLFAVGRDVATSSLRTHNNLVFGPLIVLHGDDKMAYFRSLDSSLAMLYQSRLNCGLSDLQTHLTIFARSAPEKPGVPRARTPTSTSSADLIFSM